MNGRKRPPEPFGNDPREIHMRNLMRWCDGHELRNVIGGNVKRNADGSYSLIIDKPIIRATPAAQSTGGFAGDYDITKEYPNGSIVSDGFWNYFRSKPIRLL